MGKKRAIETWTFAMVVVRRGRRILVVQETKGNQRWYLPAGRVEPGETVVQGALRETLEEAGVHVALDGVLRMEHTPGPDGRARLRVFFLAHQTDDLPPKSDADKESIQARWVTLDELDALPMRSLEVFHVAKYVLSGGAVYPMSVLTHEGAQWAVPK